MHCLPCSAAAPNWPRSSPVGPQYNPTASAAVTFLGDGGMASPFRLDWEAGRAGGCWRGGNRTTEPTSHIFYLAWNHLTHCMSRKISFSTNNTTCPTLPKGFTELSTKRAVVSQIYLLKTAGLDLDSWTLSSREQRKTQE